jgi:hypothetical protein
MTSSTAAAPCRLVLVPSVPRTERDDGIVRRYRLARLRLEGREVTREQRFGDSRRSYD